MNNGEGRQQVEVDQEAIERVHELASQMVGALGSVRSGELAMAGVEVAVRALRASGMSERTALEAIEQLAGELKRRAS